MKILLYLTTLVICKVSCIFHDTMIMAKPSGGSLQLNAIQNQIGIGGVMNILLNNKTISP